MITSKRLAIFLLLLVFALGVATGGLVMPLVAKHFPAKASAGDCGQTAKKQSRVEALSTELQLRPEQTEQLRVMVNKSRDRYSQLCNEYTPRWEEIRNQTRAAIMQILDDEQKHRFQKHIERHDRERLEQEARAEQERD